MAKTVVIDEIHLTARVPNDLPEAEAEAVRTALAGGDFMGRLRRAVRATVRTFPELSAVRLSLTRWPPTPRTAFYPSTGVAVRAYRTAPTPVPGAAGFFLPFRGPARFTTGAEGTCGRGVEIGLSATTSLRR